MSRGTRWRVFCSGALAVVAVALVVAAGSGAVGNGTSLNLPDLDQVAPYDLSVRTGGTPSQPRFLLGFGSSVENIGSGPLIIDGRRPAGSSTMVASQVITRRGGGTTRINGVGTLRYTYSPTHNHWHYLKFDRYQFYELRAEGAPRVRRDRKTGFCLGDRYRTSRYVPAARSYPTYITTCGLGATGLRSLREGISPGYGDNYDAHLEGQEIDITGLPAGRYWLVHRANSDGALRERYYSNNAASARVQLSWPNGMRARPRIKVLRRCPDRAECP
jgi:lysyl oxidase